MKNPFDFNSNERRKLLLYFIFFSLLLFLSCNEKKHSKKTSIIAMNNKALEMDLSIAHKLAQLPLKCITQEFPNKLGQVIGSKNDLATPSVLHPAFYGCFDWHSSVHGHWSLVKLLKQFPEIEDADLIRTALQKNLSRSNIESELKYFEKTINRSFERTYGWAWLLKLAEELKEWDDPLAIELDKNLQPLTDYIVDSYLEFLPRLIYPIRVGEHTNTAFALSFAWDYALASQNNEFKDLIRSRARDYYLHDIGCPLQWEPSGYDFLSPCLQEIDLMRKILSKKEFDAWINEFLPTLKSQDFELNVGLVSDRTDGKLVHLDGLNFSRAWVLYGLARQYPEYNHLVNIANMHMKYSLPNLINDDYEGGHWLASFALYAFEK